MQGVLNINEHHCFHLFDDISVVKSEPRRRLLPHRSAIPIHTSHHLHRLLETARLPRCAAHTPRHQLLLFHIGEKQYPRTQVQGRWAKQIHLLYHAEAMSLSYKDKLCECLDDKYRTGNPFKGATRIDYATNLNYSAGFIDIMLYKHQPTEHRNAAWNQPTNLWHAKSAYH